MTIIGMYDTVPLIHEAKKSGATLLEFLRGVRQENAFSARSNVLLLGAELSDIGLGNGECSLFLVTKTTSVVVAVVCCYIRSDGFGSCYTH